MLNQKNINQLVGISGLVLSLSFSIANQNIAHAYPQQNNSISPAKVAQAQNNSASSQQTIEDNDFRFQLLNCERKSKVVNCNLLITNLSTDRSLQIDTGLVRAFDLSGNEYTIKSLFLGKKTSGFTDSIVRDIPMKSGFSFEISPEVTEFTLLEIPHNSAASNALPTGFPAKLQFRNVKITPSKSPGTAR